MSWKSRTFRLSLATAGAMVTLAVLAVWASVNVPGPSNFLELDEIVANGGTNANIGYDMIPGFSFDWANSGAVTGDCTRPAGGGSPIECNGLGGIFDGGVFNGSTTVPTPPSITAAAAADNTILDAEFIPDPLSVDAAIYPHPQDPNIILNCGTGDPTVYTGMGSETNGDNINTETYATGSVPNKDEISNVYAIAHADPPNPAIPSNDDVFEIFAGFERVVNNGDSHVDLEFLQQPVSLLPSAKNACKGNLQGHRTEGDLLLSVDFTNGGEVGNQVLHVWDCGDYPDQPFVGVCDPVAHPAHGTIGPFYRTVDDQLTKDAVRQTVNNTVPVGCGGWACRNADGTQTSEVGTDEFYEVGIDLAALGFEGCISTFLPHTRSSQSFTSTLKDFEIIPFSTCNPSTILTKEVDKSVVTTGDTVTYTYYEENDGNVSLTDPSVEDDTCSPVTYDSGDDGNDVLDPGETWVFTCTSDPITSDTTNVAIGHGTFTIFGESKDVTWCEDEDNPPAGTICDQDERDTASVEVLVPSTTLNKTAMASVVTTVTYSYTETNDGEVALTPPTPGNRSSLVEDAACVAGGGTVVYTSGDDGNMILDVGETWNFSCTAVYNGPGTFDNIAIGHGIDDLGRDVTVCPSGPEAGKFCDADETDSNSVTVSVDVNNGK